MLERLPPANEVTTMRVLITIDESGADDERLEELSDRLRAELLDFDVEDAKPVRDGDPPAGARAVDVAAVAAFVVSLGGTAEAFAQIVTALRAWVGLGRSAPRTVEITVGDKTLRISDTTVAQQDRIIDEFVRSVRAG